MKILRIKVNNFNLLKDEFVIDFIPKSKKTLEDKEYELIKVDDDLYVYNTLAFIGKNASGKTTILRILDIAYEILSMFRIDTFKHLINNNLTLEIMFYHDKKIYIYKTDLENVNNIINFKNQSLLSRTYNKLALKNINDYSKYKDVLINNTLPKDTSILFNVLNNIETRALYYSSYDYNTEIYFNIYKLLGENNELLIKDILRLFDNHILNIELTKYATFKITYSDKTSEILSSKELFEKLSSGTSKGIALYTYVIYSLNNGVDLIVDEIENHFHRTLVDNLINLYKDKRVNKKGATLIFSTHYPELLDLFNRSDNIYITKNNGGIYVENAYTNYNARSELLKSKRFYQNAFDTNVSYEALMKFKEDLM